MCSDSVRCSCCSAARSKDCTRAHAHAYTQKHKVLQGSALIMATQRVPWGPHHSAAQCFWRAQERNKADRASRGSTTSPPGASLPSSLCAHLHKQAREHRPTVPVRTNSRASTRIQCVCVLTDVHAQTSCVRVYRWLSVRVSVWGRAALRLSSCCRRPFACVHRPGRTCACASTSRARTSSCCLRPFTSCSSAVTEATSSASAWASACRPGRSAARSFNACARHTRTGAQEVGGRGSKRRLMALAPGQRLPLTECGPAPTPPEGHPSGALVWYAHQDPSITLCNTGGVRQHIHRQTLDQQRRLRDGPKLSNHLRGPAGLNPLGAVQQWRCPAMAPTSNGADQ